MHFSSAEPKISFRLMPTLSCQRSAIFRRLQDGVGIAVFTRRAFHRSRSDVTVSWWLLALPVMAVLPATGA